MTISSAPSLKGQHVLVTGGTGFIGRCLITRLQAEGAVVSALLRSARHAAALAEQDVRTHVGDLRDGAVCAGACAGQDALVHLAHDMRAGAGENLAAFETLTRAATREGVGRLIHASSIVVYDDWPHGAVSESSSMDRPGGGPYRQAKIEMERRLMAGDMPCVILQPTLVWGPGSAFWTTRFLEVFKRGGTVVLPDPAGEAPLLHVRDLAAAFVAALALPDPGRERFIISGPAPVPWSDLMAGYQAHIGKGTIRHEPEQALRAGLGPQPDRTGDATPPLAARISARARRIIGHQRFEALVSHARRVLGPKDLCPDRHLLELFTAPGHVSTRQARDRLGFQADIDLESGLRTLGDT